MPNLIPSKISAHLDLVGFELCLFFLEILTISGLCVFVLEKWFFFQHKFGHISGTTALIGLKGHVGPNAIVIWHVHYWASLFLLARPTRQYVYFENMLKEKEFIICNLILYWWFSSPQTEPAVACVKQIIYV